MLRHIIHDLEWAIAFVTLTLIIFLIIALLTIKPAIATITETDIAPGQIHCRSEQVLTDAAGHKWQIMFFTQVDSTQVPSLNLRLSGLSSSLRIQHQKPLVISTLSDKLSGMAKSKGLAPQPLRYEATDIFLEESPLPSIGQYNLKNIFPQLPTVNLLLEVPLENGKYARLQIPKPVIKEWQEVAAKNPGASQKLPSGFQLVC